MKPPRAVAFLGWFSLRITMEIKGVPMAGRSLGAKWLVNTRQEAKTTAAGISVLASVGVYMREIADLASSRWLKPDPKSHFFFSEEGLPWLGNG